MTDVEITESIEARLEEEGPTKDAMSGILEKILNEFDCQTGTIHTLDPGSRILHLQAHRGIPDVIIDKVSAIPIGKGMAGLAAQRREPVQVCNLQMDESGVAKPGAKETAMEGSIALPMLDGDALRGTLGVAKPIEYEFSQEETDRLMRIGAVIAKYVASA